MTTTRAPRLPIAIATSILLASTFALAGCSSAGSTTSAASGSTSGSSNATTSNTAKTTTKVDPCVLTAKEVGAVVNQPLTTAETAGSTCRYSGGGYFFSVEVKANQKDSDWQTEVGARSIAHKPATISGVGDRAVASGLVLVAQSRAYIVEVLALDDPGTTTWPKSIAVAKAIIAKLP
jgi:hypothetical protein